jgi:hypothetical protein
MILRDNYFVEQVLPARVLRPNGMTHIGVATSAELRSEGWRIARIDQSAANLR